MKQYSKEEITKARRRMRVAASGKRATKAKDAVQFANDLPLYSEPEQWDMNSEWVKSIPTTAIVHYLARLGIHAAGKRRFLVGRIRKHMETERTRRDLEEIKQETTKHDGKARIDIVKEMEAAKTESTPFDWLNAPTKPFKWEQPFQWEPQLEFSEEELKELERSAPPPQDYAEDVIDFTTMDYPNSSIDYSANETAQITAEQSADLVLNP